RKLGLGALARSTAERVAEVGVAKEEFEPVSEQNDVVDRDEVTGRAVGDQLEQRLDLGADDRNSGGRRMARRFTPDRVAIGHADKRGRRVGMFDRPVADRSEREWDSGSGSAPLAPRDVPLLRSTFAKHSNRGW